jgi:hypothetical protein
MSRARATQSWASLWHRAGVQLRTANCVLAGVESARHQWGGKPESPLRHVCSRLLNSSVLDDPIDLVLVTGAGASCEFGVNQTRLPLMAEWSELVLRKLREVPGFVEAVGLTEGMTGEQFEDRLGGFLRSVVAFRDVRSLLGPLGQMLRCNAPATAGGANQQNTWDIWHEQALFQIDQVLGRLYESLYESFGAPNYDPALVRNAYANLLNQLGIDQHSRWVYATTNYDVIADAALESLGLTFDDGTRSPRFANSAERQFRVAGLLSVIDRDVPLLHLHGRVGWLVRSGPGRSGPYAVDHMTSWKSDFGVPLVMLPDPHKQPGDDGIIGPMWAEFRDALRRAKRVLVLGHSLHDAPLVEALKVPAEAGRLAVTLFGEPTTGEKMGDAAVVEQTLTERLPDAHRILTRFGPSYGPNPSTDMKGWLETTES